tara:strand:- start:32797 stop:33387 length:591 start_codon:yes stop_codon:yes gene_type:complete
MSFWESELGEVTGNAADAFAKSFTQIPDGTMALAKIDGFVNAEYNGNKYLSISWLLTDGDFKGAKVEQKLKVFGDPMAKDSAKARHRALNMLKLLYQLFKIKPTHAGDPTDQDLASFTGRSAGIKIRETEPNDQGRQYNWVAEIHEAKGFKCETGISVVVTHTNTQTYHAPGQVDSAFSRNQAAVSDQDLTDDIPF